MMLQNISFVAGSYARMPGYELGDIQNKPHRGRDQSPAPNSGCSLVVIIYIVCFCFQLYSASLWI